ncbi:hypothetical protein L596_014046 [Steinernema carpocapsae]|uniref:MSL3 chromodomain-like domain-containing protein n=1 Tax=Steinernema carpocapsae TaxID=34508 RepID=A0A4U5NBK8_STECR|nr:hypothetical protein L596_014046 [Steinernema carpocapsae]
MPPKPKYQVGEEILCLDTVSGLSYPAKIVKIVKEGRETVYRVHYQGWHVKHDEDVRERDTSSRFKELTQESQEQAKDEIKEARRKAQKPSKRKSVASGALNTPAAKATPKTEVPRTRAVKTPAKQAPSTRTPGTRTSVVRSSVATSSPPKTPAPKISRKDPGPDDAYACSTSLKAEGRRFAGAASRRPLRQLAASVVRRATWI